MDFYIHPILNHENQKKFLMTSKESGRQAYVCVDAKKVYHETAPHMPVEEQMHPEELEQAFDFVKQNILKEKQSLEKKIAGAKESVKNGGSIDMGRGGRD